MPPQQHGGKKKVAYLPIGYYRRPMPRKLVASVAAGLVLFASVILAATGHWKRMDSLGPINQVHAAWEMECFVCHKGVTQPTGNHNGLHLLGGTSAGANSSDSLCQNCHLGPAHHEGTEKPEEVGNCASCHTDHRGRQATLTAISDSACTRCHANLAAHQVDVATKPNFADIDHFALAKSDSGDGRGKAHIEFELGPENARKKVSAAKDPGKLRFNHELHLKLGSTEPNAPAVPNRTLGDITDLKLRERYRQEQPKDRRKDTDYVQLQCAQCHQLDSTDTRSAGAGHTTPSRSPGDYMLPVNYQQHCVACHPLTFDPQFADVSVPHHLQPPDVHRFLWGKYAEKEAGNPPVAKSNAPSSPLPGSPTSPEAAAMRKKITDQTQAAQDFLFQEPVRKAERYIYQGRTACGLCHYFERSSGQALPTQVVATNVPRMWFEHSTFDHRAHRVVDCLECHVAVPNSIDEKDVLLPGIGTCRTCHGPVRHTADGRTGGVRDTCITCHRYHNGKEPKAGLGAHARGVKSPRTMHEFLNGQTPPADPK